MEGIAKLGDVVISAQEHQLGYQNGATVSSID
jgi:hypothetical protein